MPFQISQCWSFIFQLITMDSWTDSICLFCILVIYVTYNPHKKEMRRDMLSLSITISSIRERVLSLLPSLLALSCNDHHWLRTTNWFLSWPWTGGPWPCLPPLPRDEWHAGQVEAAQLWHWNISPKSVSRQKAFPPKRHFPHFFGGGEGRNRRLV